MFAAQKGNYIKYSISTLYFNIFNMHQNIKLKSFISVSKLIHVGRVEFNVLTRVGS